MINGRKKYALGLRTVVSLFFLMGCARVSIDSKKPIKLDVTMRVDIYQHVSQDAQAIEDMVSSPKPGKKGTASGESSRLSWGVEEAYAEEGASLPAEVREAIERRKDRKESLVSWEAKGIVGENAKGLAEVRNPSVSGEEISILVKEENKDRQIIYQHVAVKNGASVEETAKVFAERIQGDSPSGTPLEVSDGQWITKE